MDDILPGWTVFDHPSDYPDCFVARQWLADRDGTVTQTSVIIRGSTLSELRAKLPIHLVNIGRYPQDDSKIVEVWI